MRFRQFNHSMLLGFILLAAVAFVAGNRHAFAGMWHRNLGMLLFSKAAISQKVQDRTADIIAQLHAAQHDANDLLLQSRLASIAPSLTPQHLNQILFRCDDDYSRFASIIAEPVYADAGIKKQIYLSAFEEIGGAQGTLKFTSGAQNTCEAHLAIDFTEGANRYVTLSARTPVQPDATYRLTAQIFVGDNQQAFFGIQSRWQEMKVPPNSGWQKVSYTFRTGVDAASEIVQVLVTGGKGDIKVKKVILERLP